MKRLQRGLLIGLLVVAGTEVAHAALFDDEEARRRIEATNQRLAVMQRQIDDRLLFLEQQAKSGGLADLATQIQLLQGDIAKLRGGMTPGSDEPWWPVRLATLAPWPGESQNGVGREGSRL